MDANNSTRSERLAASLARAQADLEAAKQSRAYFDGRAFELRAVAAEQPTPQGQAHYTNASVIYAGHVRGADREIAELLALIEDLTKAIAAGECDLPNAEACAAMDDTMGALA